MKSLKEAYVKVCETKKIIQQFRLDPFSTSLFVFRNRRKDKIRILYRDKNGFRLYYRGLEEGRFQWPDKYYGKSNPAVTKQQLTWILDSLNLCEPDAHRRGRSVFVRIFLLR